MEFDAAQRLVPADAARFAAMIGGFVEIR